MGDDIQPLMDKILKVLIGHDIPVILTALSQVTGAMIGQYSSTRGEAKAKVEVASLAMRKMVDITMKREH